MVTIKTFLPPDENLDLLARLRAPLRLSKSADPFFKTVPFQANKAAILLCNGKAVSPVELVAEYGDVVFKFEMFSIVPIEASNTLLEGFDELATFDDWNDVKYVLATEWLEDDRTRIVRGSRAEIPADTVAVGVSMVGILFQEVARNLPVGMIWTDESDPCSLLVSSETQEIREFTADCEIVAARDFPRWKRRLLKWCASRDPRFEDQPLKPRRIAALSR